MNMLKKRFLPMYSDLPPTKEELLQLRLVEEARKRGSLKSDTETNPFLDSPVTRQVPGLPVGTALVEFGDEPNMKKDLQVIRSINQLSTDPEYASLYYKQATRPQIRPPLMGAAYGTAAGALGGYALGGSGTSAKLGAGVGALLGLLTGIKRSQANRTIAQGAFQGVIPEADKVSEEEQDKARKFNKLTSVGAPAAVGVTAALAALRAIVGGSRVS